MTTCDKKSKQVPHVINYQTMKIVGLAFYDHSVILPDITFKTGFYKTHNAKRFSFANII